MIRGTLLTDKIAQSARTGLLAIGLLLSLGPSTWGNDRIDISINTTPIDVPGSTFAARHRSFGEELYDVFDGAWSTAPFNPNSQWLRLQTNPYGTNLFFDARPLDSMTIFSVEGVGIDTTATEINSLSNYLSFAIVSGLATNRKDYLYDLKVFGTNDATIPYFREGGSLRDVLSNNNARIYGHFALAGITNNQIFLQMPFIPVTDSASFVIEAGPNGAAVLHPTATNVISGVNGRYWTEEGQDVTILLQADADHVPVYATYNSTTNVLLDATSGDATETLSNVAGWTDGVTNKIYVVFAPAETVSGTPAIWYMERGIIQDFETYDTTDFNNDGITGRQKFLMGVDDLFDNTDYFSTISLEVEDGTPTVSIPHSKTNRRYRIERTPYLNPPDWTSPTNSLGTGGTLSLDMPEESEDTIYYRGAVELP